MRARPPLTISATSSTIASAGHTPRLPLSATAATPSAQASAVHTSSPEGRVNTASTISAISASANTIALAVQPSARSVPLAT